MALGQRLSRDGETTGTRPAGAAVILRSSPATVAKAPDHQRGRTQLRGSALPDTADGLLRHRAMGWIGLSLSIFSPFKPGLEKPHSPSFHIFSQTP